MSKSIVLAENERSIGHSETRAEFGDDVIMGIWNLIRDTPRLYPWLGEIVNDAYQDFLIQNSDVPQLKNEILRLLKELTPKINQSLYPGVVFNITWLRVLSALAESAIEFRLNMYGFAD